MEKLKYYLQIADNALILSHRLSEYCSHAPFLEEDLANSNVSLDLIGIAENVYEEAAKMKGTNTTADDLVYRRDEHEYLNSLMVEQPNTDFAYLITRQFFTDAYHFYFFSLLLQSKDEKLVGIAQKAIKEITYHLKRSSEWMVRLGQGTELSNTKMQKAIHYLWRFNSDFFIESDTDKQMKAEGIGVDLMKVKEQWNQKINEVFYLANLKKPTDEPTVGGGKRGMHTEHLGHLLANMQFLTNKYPEAIW